MTRRTARMVLQENRCSDAQGGPPASAPLVPASTAANDAVFCPVSKCAGRLREEGSAYDSRTGLEQVACPLCGHRGFRSREGVLLLFRGGYEYKFSYGPSLQTITVVLSSAAVNLWGTHGLTDDQLAKEAAEWALLCGHTTRRVHLGIPAEEFADFYLYFCRE